jgi:hypothetical protein
MRVILGTVLMSLLLVGCSQSGENRGAYSEKGGGSMEGAGGAGPGYDGTRAGHGKEGLASGSGTNTAAGNGQTNNAIPNPTGEKAPQ